MVNSIDIAKQCQVFADRIQRYFNRNEKETLNQNPPKIKQKNKKHCEKHDINEKHCGKLTYKRSIFRYLNPIQKHIHP